MKEIANNIRTRFQRPVLAAGAFVGAALTSGAVCTEEPQEPTPVSPPNVVRPIDPEPVEQFVDPYRFLDYPLDRGDGENYKIQQAYQYSFQTSKRHEGTDYIKGQVDDAPWKSFDVLSAAPGEACVNPIHHEGLAVFISHDRPDGIYKTYYGHLKNADKDIPQCNQNGVYYTKTKHVEVGEVIGEAGADGVFDKDGNKQPDWVHLHFGVIGPSGQNLDPYDIYSTRENYPDLLFTNNLTCGEKTLWNNCPIGDRQAELAPTIALVPTIERVEEFDRPDIPTVAPRVETRQEEIDRKWNLAIGLGQKFIGFMLDGSPQAIAQAQAMQITPSETRIYPLSSYDIAPAVDLANCSRDMREGQFQQWTVLRDDPRSHIYTGSTPAEKLNKEQGLLGNDRYNTRSTFTFNKFNLSARARIGFQTYTYLYLESSLTFEDTGDDLKLATNNLCFSIGSPIGGQYDWTFK